MKISQVSKNVARFLEHFLLGENVGAEQKCI